MTKYLILLKIAAKRQWAERRVIYLRMLFLFVVIFIFSRLWEVLRADFHDVVNPANFVWYLLITETIYFSRMEGMQKVIQDDVRTGNIAYAVLRPISYFNLKLAESLGGMLVRTPIIFLLGGIAVFLFSGGWPDTPQGLIAALVLTPFAIMVMMIAHIFIGMTSFIIQDSSPLYWIYTKCDMTFGGLFFPLTIYPLWMQNIAYKTPFAWTGWGIARLVYEFSWPAAAETLAYILLWMAAFYALGLVTFRSIVVRLQVNGG